MVRKIIACADIHIRNLRRQEEYQEQLQKFIDQCNEISKNYEKDEIRIVIAGDLLHNKLDISGEAYILATWFLKQLDKIAKTIVIAGNHDMNMSNLSRLDSISTIFSMCKFNQVYYLDKELNYESGCMVDDNIVWCLYSSFDNFSKPNVDEYKIEYPDKAFIGLYHGLLTSSKTDTGFVVENGLEPSFFSNLDMCIMGHIHKRQCIKYEGVPIIYCGSLIQQNHGENLSGHGYIVIDTDTFEHESVDIENNDHGFYTFTLNGIDDIDKNTENLINI